MNTYFVRYEVHSRVHSGEVIGTGSTVVESMTPLGIDGCGYDLIALKLDIVRLNHPGYADDARHIGEMAAQTHIVNVSVLSTT